MSQYPYPRAAKKNDLLKYTSCCVAKCGSRTNINFSICCKNSLLSHLFQAIVVNPSIETRKHMIQTILCGVSISIYKDF